VRPRASRADLICRTDQYHSITKGKQ